MTAMRQIGRVLAVLAVVLPVSLEALAEPKVIDLTITGGALPASQRVLRGQQSVVLGHILAVYLAHVIALREFRDYRLALRSQYPMLVLMVAYTVASLWIIAQPIVETGGA